MKSMERFRAARGSEPSSAFAVRIATETSYIDFPGKLLR
jgi:hypothetical protein